MLLIGAILFLALAPEGRAEECAEGFVFNDRNGDRLRSGGEPGLPGWRLPLDRNFLPQFYYVHKPAGSPGLEFDGTAPTGPLPESIDFPLYESAEPDRFDVIVFGDTQTEDIREIDFFARDIVEEAVGTEAAFGVTLGDIVNDDLSLFNQYNGVTGRIGIPRRAEG